MKKITAFFACLAICAALFALPADTADLTYEPSEAYRLSKFYTAFTEVELTGDYTTDLLNVAMSQVGYHEGDCLADLGGGNSYGKSNKTEYGAYMGCQAEWCAMFISWCARQARIPYSALRNSYYATADDFGLEYMAKSDYAPRPGDIIFFDWEIDGFNTAEPASAHGDHVGIVYDADEENVYYVDGNFNHQVKKRYAPLDDVNIKGYGLFSTADDGDEPLYIGSVDDAEKLVKLPDYMVDNHPGVQNPFTDVKGNDYFHSAVMWGVANKIASGVSETEFAPYRKCTRAELVTFIWNACGCREPGITENPFTDADENAYYFKAMLWCFENGYVSGTSADCFSPDMMADRAQVVTILYRIAGSPKSGTYCPFSDVSGSAYYRAAVLWAVDKGITSGTSANTFSPGTVCDRGQMITFLYGFMAS